MSNTIHPHTVRTFEHDGRSHPIRFVKAANESLVVLHDVGQALGYNNPSGMLALTAHAERHRIRVPTETGSKVLTCIAMPVLRRVLARSRVRAAPTFEAWLTSSMRPIIITEDFKPVAVPPVQQIDDTVARNLKFLRDLADQRSQEIERLRALLAQVAEIGGAA